MASTWDTENIDHHLDEMIGSHFTYQEVEASLREKSSLHDPELTAKLRERFIHALKKTMRLYNICLIIFGLLTFGLLLMDYYDSVSASDQARYSGAYLGFAKWPAGISILCLLRIGWIAWKILRLKRGRRINHLVVKDVSLPGIDR